MANSSPVVAHTKIYASQYNNLRNDVLDIVTAHDHSGAADHGPAIPLSGLSDVDMAGVAHGNLVVYNAATGKYEPVTPTWASYLRIVQETYPHALIGYWPLNEASGTDALDQSGNGRNGGYVGPSFALAQTGIGDGQTSVSVTADAVDIYSTSLAAAFNSSAGTFACWAKVANAGVWTDGTNRYILSLYASGGYVRIFRGTLDNWLNFVYDASGTEEQLYVQNRGDTDWMHVALTWDKAADEARCYINGRLALPVETGLGTWSGALNSALTCLGALRSDSYNNPWQGFLAHAALWSVALPPQQIANLHDAVRPCSNILALGDSKTNDEIWIRYLCQNLVTATGRTTEESPTRYGLAGATVDVLEAAVLAGLPAEWQTPRWCTINIGANDVASLPAAATWKASLTSIIDAVRAKWPNALVYVAKPWRRSYGAECTTLAGWITTVIGTYSSGVYAGPDENTWLENGDDGATYTSDGIHYSAAGETECAAEWQTILGY